MDKNVSLTVNNWLNNLGIDPDVSSIATQFIFLFVVLLLSYLSRIITRQIVLHRMKIFISKSKTNWDDLLLESKAFDRAFRLIPPFVVYFLSFFVFDDQWQYWIQKLAMINILFISVLTVDALLNGFILIYRTFEIAKERPIKGYIQVLKIFLYVIFSVLILSQILNKPAWGLLTGIGAMTAILLLVFKDSILGLVASFQLTSNKMVSIGDWIEMPKYGADGEVIETSLNTVKVRNWDKTITTIPTYSLVSNSFKNWRGMTESGGRRIKRALYINMSTIKFCDEQLTNRLKKLKLLSGFIQEKLEDIKTYNAEQGFGPGDLSARRLTNIGLFRHYVIHYLKINPKIHKDLTFLVRQLAPTENGLPIEIYVFSNDQAWVNYEGIQGDIFDHLLAVLSEFELQVFQNPTGYDFKELMPAKV